MKLYLKDVLQKVIYGLEGNYGIGSKLLAYIGEQFHGKVLAEIGTRMGEGAFALSYNPTNTIITYDIVGYNKPPYIQNKFNIDFRIRDILYNDRIKEVLYCPFIYLDVDPHDGNFENRFIYRLEEYHYGGIILCDDIQDDKLHIWWNNLKTPAYKYYLPGHCKELNRWGILDYTHKMKIIPWKL